MDEIKTNVPKTFADRVSAIRNVVVLAAIVAIAAVGYSYLPDTRVSAQEEAKPGIEENAVQEVATQGMIDFALNLRSASEYTVYAEKGIVENSSEIRGAKADALGVAGTKSTRALANSIDALRQLPCTDMKGSLTGKVFTPGVYCFDAAELNGEMVIDGQGSAAGAVIFRVGGTLNAKSGSSIRLANGAQGGNVYFVAENAEIESNVAFRANVLASGDINVGAGSTVSDKVLSLGKVTLETSVVQGGTTGWLEICKEQQLPVAPENDLANRIFHYVVTGVAAGLPGSSTNPLKVPVGSCSGLIEVAGGAQTVTELNTGTLINPPSGTFTGNFELISVTNLTPQSPSTLGLVNFATRTANINIVANDGNAQLILRFTNRAAITGFIEICKRAAIGAPVRGDTGNVGTTIPWPGPGQTMYNPPGTAPLSGGDPDVTGFFQFTIEDVYSVNTSTTRTLQIFNVPVGQCTGPIAVTKGDPPPIGTPRRSAVYVSELPRTGFYLESVEVIPANRANGPAVLGTIVGVNSAGQDTFISAPGGGYQDVVLEEGGTSANETLVIFANRSNPGMIKVCKVAGPGVPINTLFTYTVRGWGATLATHPQNNTYGIVTRTFDVRAGDPAQGGSCTVVPGVGAPPPGYNQFQTFVNGTPVIVYENGISVNNTIPQPAGQLLTAQIRVFGSTFTTTAHAGFSPNPDLTPGDVIPGATQTRTFTTGNISTPIPDNGTVSVPVNVPPTERILDVNASIRVNHTWAEDLDISLSHPDNTTIDLSSDNGSSGDNYGSGANSCAGTPTVFDDEAATSITAGTAPFAGSYQPEQALSAFDGKTMNGTWNFRFVDDESLISGTVYCATLIIQSEATSVARAAVYARAGTVEVEFTNFYYNPTTLKVCKVGSGATLGQTFNFNVALTSPVIGGPNPGPIFPGAPQTNVSVIAGSAAQGGNCTIVPGGPFPGGAINQGSTVVITETNGTPIGSTCPSCGPGGWTPGTGGGTLSGPNGVVAGVNSVVITNGPGGPAPISERAVKFDFDGDRKADAAVWTPSNGNWSWKSSLESGALKVRPFGIAGDKLVAADYNGDNKTDYAVYRPSEGRWYVQSAAGFTAVSWGEAGDIPQAGDYDGDGKADFAVFRPSNGTWYIRTATDNFRIFQFGIPSDVPYAADYNGDGVTDAGIFRNGTWYTLASDGFRVTQFGQSGDVPVPADYDGDGIADVAVFRGGTWYVRTQSVYYTRQLGTAADVPVPADYDGDGKSDIAIFRAGEGKWYIQRSTLGEGAGDDTVTLGSATDTAVQAQ